MAVKKLQRVGLVGEKDFKMEMEDLVTNRTSMISLDYIVFRFFRKQLFLIIMLMVGFF